MDDLGITKTAIQAIGAGIMTAIGGIIGMFAKQKALEARMTAAESRIETDTDKIDRIDRTVTGLSSTMTNFGDKLAEIKDGQDGIVDRLFNLLKGGTNG